jgi:hypothetical protein
MRLGFFFLTITILACGPQDPSSCENDNQCLEERICVAGACAEPLGEGEGDTAEGEGEGEGEERIGEFLLYGTPLNDQDSITSVDVQSVTATNDCEFTFDSDRNRAIFTFTACRLANGGVSITVQMAYSVGITITGEDAADRAVGPGSYELMGTPSPLECEINETFQGGAREVWEPFVVDATTALGFHTFTYSCGDGAFNAVLGIEVLFNALPQFLVDQPVAEEAQPPTERRGDCSFSPPLAEVLVSQSVDFTCTTATGSATRPVFITITP